MQLGYFDWRRGINFAEPCVRTHLTGLHALNDPVFVGRFPITLVFPVPEVKNLRRHKTILSLDAQMAEPENQICIFVAPALKSLIESVDLKKILAPDAQITASDAAPVETLFYPE